MKITLLVIGKTSADYLREGIEIYTKRLSHYVNFQMKALADIRATKGMTLAQQKVKEGEMMMREFATGDWVALLDERGKMMTSREFATSIDKRMSTMNRNIWFVIGGPYGFSDEVYRRADELVSLSKMTFSHEMIRLFFTEQLYRAFTILNGEPYHHD